MLEYINGILSSADPHKVIIDVQGLGYGLFISVSTFKKLPQIGTKIKIFISEIIREDSHRLFGFLTQDERDFFEHLNQISGIGPKLSITILGHMSLEELYLATKQNNIRAISTIPGIGKKTAERLLLELTDQFKKFDKTPISSSQPMISDAINALINLGYNALEAQKCIEKALSNQKKTLPLSELITLALKVKK